MGTLSNPASMVTTRSLAQAEIATATAKLRAEKEKQKEFVSKFQPWISVRSNDRVFVSWLQIRSLRRPPTRAEQVRQSASVRASS